MPLLVRKRVGWLMLLFIAQGYTGTVLQNFQGELAAVVALSFFIPLLIGTGGNVGSQTVTLVVRAMALGEVALRDMGWLVFKELRVGLVMGLVMGVARARPGVVPRRLLGHRDGGLDRRDRDLRLGGDGRRGAAADPAPARRRPGGRLGAADLDARRRHRPDHLLRDRAARPRAVGGTATTAAA